MALIGRDEALQRLTHHLQPFRRACLAAWADWLALPPEVRMDLCSTTRAGFVHDKAITHAIRLLDSNVVLMDLSGLRVFVIEQAIAVRIKKFDADLFSKNQRTQQVLDFHNQFTIPGLSQSFNLELGYVLDPLQQQISGVHLTCPNGVRNHYWQAEIADHAAVVKVRDIFDQMPEVEDVGSTKFVPKPQSDTKKVVPFMRKEGEDDSPNG